MIKRAKKLISHPLASGSAVLFITSIAVNFGNYIFNLLAGRMLGPKEYGVFASLVALFIIFSIPSTILQTIIIKFTSGFKAKNDINAIKALFWDFTKKIGIFSISLFLLLILFSQQIVNYLKISSITPVIFWASIFLITFLGTANNSFLQGLLRFFKLSLGNILGAISKLGFGLGLAYLGFGVNGLLLGFFASIFIPYIYTFIPLRDVLTHQDGHNLKLNYKEIISFSLPALIAVLGIGLFYTVDVVLVKHFFDEYQAGLYSALSVVGRVIFFASSSITSVMFALSSHNHAKGENTEKIFLMSLILVAAGSLAIASFYFLFPNFTMNFFFGEKFLAAAPYLGVFAVFITLFALCNLMVNFFLSTQRYKILFLPILGAVLQAGLIYRFHESFDQIIMINIFVVGGLFVILSGYLLLGSKLKFSH